MTELAKKLNFCYNPDKNTSQASLQCSPRGVFFMNPSLLTYSKPFLTITQQIEQLKSPPRSQAPAWECILVATWREVCIPNEDVGNKTIASGGPFMRNIYSRLSFPSSCLGMHIVHSNIEQIISRRDVLLPSWSLGARWAGERREVAA